MLIRKQKSEQRTAAVTEERRKEKHEKNVMEIGGCVCVCKLWTRGGVDSLLSSLPMRTFICENDAEYWTFNKI